MRKIYFDNAATTKMHPKVLEAMLPYLNEYYGNPSSIHSFGRKARVAIEEAREVISDFLNCDTSEIYFTSSGTESNNFIIGGIANTEFNESGKNAIISSTTEHKSVLDTLEYLKSKGFQTKLMNVNKDGSISIEILKKHIENNNLSLVSIIDTNNETGIKNNIKILSELIHECNIYFHTDAVQSFGKEKIDVRQLNVDALTASAHKINGPKGVGLAYIKSGTPIMPLIFGGSQERNRRGGTENVAGIVGFAESVKVARENMFDNFEYVKELRDYFKAQLQSFNKGSIVINESTDNSPYVLSISFLPEYYNIDPESILMFLDLNGIAVSNGAACTSGTVKSSHVIKAMGKTTKYAEGTIRFSFSRENNKEEIDYTINVLSKLANQIRK